MNNLLKNLNSEQKQAVTHEAGPLLIVAGAGTGKTTVITERIAYLINEKKCRPEEILALTFTDKAAGEMEERVDRLLPYGYVDLWISTFHAFGERLLKNHGLEIGLSNDFKLLNTTQQWLLVRQNLDKFNLDYYRPLGNPTKFIHVLIKHFSRAKDECIAPQNYLDYVEELKMNSDSAEFVRTVINDETKKQLSKKELKEFIAQEILKQEEIANAYHTYQQLLLDNNVLDFGDLINYTFKLFKERKNILAKYRQQFKYILVDEFQDTNYAQYELLKLLADPKQNITVVGDDDQCLPPEALIETDKGEKAIKNIKVGNKVTTAVGRGYLSYSPVTKILKNKKEANFIIFKTARGYHLKVTDNHKLFCFVPAIDDRKYHYIYLMHRKNLGWRMGVTNDLALRLRLERSADRILGIKTCQSEAEAKFYEILYSLKYNIPTVCFQERNGVVIKGEWLNKLYQQINTESNAKKLANDLNLDLTAHHYSLAAVNRGGQLRIKINLEMCHRRYRNKFAKNFYLINPKVTHHLSVETSDLAVIKKLKKAGFKLQPARKGYRLRLYSADLQKLGRTALKIEKITDGILEISAKLGRENIQTRKTLVMPAKNVLIGQYLPVLTKKGVIYDRVVKKIEEKEKTSTVYDLEIANTHNFIADGVVVHNSIYKFRGASISNILQFKDDYPQTKEIFLTKNYRGKQNILDLSYKFIQQNNPYRLEVKLAKDKKLSKKLIAEKSGQGTIEHLYTATIADEIKLAVEKIIELYQQGKGETNWSDFAILARANSSADNFVYGLEQANIPYNFVASKGLYAKKVVLDLLAYLKLLDNYHEGAAMYRVLTLPIWEFSQHDIVNLNYWANRRGWSLYEAIRQIAGFKNISNDGKEKINKLLQMIDRHSQMARENKNTTEIIQVFLEASGYLKNLTSDDSLANREQLNYLNQFYKKIQDFERENSDKSLKNFLALVELELEAGEEGALEQNWEEEGPDTVKVMTIHSAKGLEFKYVFIVNLVDKRFPTISHSDPIELPEKLIKEIIPEGDVHLMEERRLFYVAMTRAKEGIYFTSADDYGGARKKKLSCFLFELAESGFKLSSKIKPQNSRQAADQPIKIVREEEGLDISEFLPAKFSFTQLKAFENCPYQYRFAHILKVPTRGKPQFSFGKSLHLTMQKLFQLINLKKTNSQTDLFDKDSSQSASISWEELLAIYKNSFIDDWYPDRATCENYWEKGKKILKGFYDKYSSNWPQVKYLEYPFNLRLDNEESYIIRGFIDRVDEVKEGVRLVDYKTGNVKSQLDSEDKEQLLIYQLAAQEVMGEKVKELIFYYLDDNKEVAFLGQAAELEKVKNKIIKTIEEIKKGEFPPKPSRLCQYCDFKNICEFRA